MVSSYELTDAAICETKIIKTLIDGSAKVKYRRQVLINKEKNHESI